jgi:hypothetical protein
MEPTPRLYQCVRCHKQTTICRQCDRGNIYCNNGCSALARILSLKLAGARYQATLNGKHHHAARQARYRTAHQIKVTHQGSPPLPQNDSIESLEYKPKKTETGQQNTTLTCCFCRKPVSVWIRNDFIRRRGLQKSNGSQARPQAP